MFRLRVASLSVLATPLAGCLLGWGAEPSDSDALGDSDAGEDSTDDSDTGRIDTSEPVDTGCLDAGVWGCVPEAVALKTFAGSGNDVGIAFSGAAAYVGNAADGLWEVPLDGSPARQLATPWIDGGVAVGDGYVVYSTREEVLVGLDYETVFTFKSFQLPDGPERVLADERGRDAIIAGGEVFFRVNSTWDVQRRVLDGSAPATPLPLADQKIWKIDGNTLYVGETRLRRTTFDDPSTVEDLTQQVGLIDAVTFDGNVAYIEASSWYRANLDAPAIALTLVLPASESRIVNEESFAFANGRLYVSQWDRPDADVHAEGIAAYGAADLQLIDRVARIEDYATLRYATADAVYFQGAHPSEDFDGWVLYRAALE